MEATNETVLYRGTNATVTNRRVQIGQREYPLSGVQNVSVIRPLVRRSYGLIALAVGVLLVVVGYIAWNGVLLSPMVGGIALILVGLAIYAIARENYTVRLHEVNGEVVALDLSGEQQAQEIAAAINSAVGTTHTVR